MFAGRTTDLKTGIGYACAGHNKVTAWFVPVFTDFKSSPALTFGATDPIGSGRVDATFKRDENLRAIQDHTRRQIFE